MNISELIAKLQELESRNGSNVKVLIEVGTAHGGRDGIGAEYVQENDHILIYDERLH